MKAKNVDYRWPDLSPVVRQYIVIDDHGRYGVAVSDSADMLSAHPIDVSPSMTATPESGLPTNSIMMTRTVWHLQSDETYRGIWYDYNGPAHITDDSVRHLTIVTDLGIKMPDQWADIALKDSDQSGHWDYGATLGKVGGKTPVNGQKPDEMTTEQAMDYAKDVGEKITRRGIRLAAKSGYIPGARKVGRDWLITYEGFNYYLDNRPKRGPKQK